MTLGTLKCTTIEDDGGNSSSVADLIAKAGTASPTFTGTVTMPATVAFAGQASDITLDDNQAAALEIKEDTNAYVTFNTTDSGEQIEVDKAVVASENITLENEKVLRLSESGSNSNFIGLKAPADLSGADTTYTLPAAPGQANLVLSSTTGGVMSWVANPDTDTVFSVDTAHTYTAGQRAEVTNIDSSSGVLAIDFDASNNFLCITTENITDINYTNLDEDMVGQTGSIFFQYGGAHTVGGWDTETRWIGGTGGTSEAPTFTATSGQCDRVDYIIVGDRDTPSQRSHVRVQMVASLNYAD